MYKSLKRIESLKILLGVTFFILLNACTAHYPINNPIISTNQLKDYSLEGKSDSGRSDDLLLLLTFSGGGTRAASFSYGVLQTLAETQIMVNDKKRRLLDEVDGISSVSGGSFTAAYYGLFGDRIFKDFETKFLKRNVQSELAKRLFSPFSWPKLASLYFERSDLAAEYYDEILFENKTFQDFVTSKGPLIAINATDAALGSQFTFFGNQFAPICTDLASFPVSRAVTASSAVPGAFSSIILKNYAGTCNYQLPEWATRALHERNVTTREYQHANRINNYLLAEQYPYIHLFDGGISDNLGIRAIVDTVFMEGGIWKKLIDLDLDENTTKIAIIVVNARKEMDVQFTKKDYSIPLFDTISVATSIPLDKYSFETMEILRNNMSQWRTAITARRCQGKKKPESETSAAVSTKIPECEVQTYLIEVSFELMADESEREYLDSLPTSFNLEPNDVDRLKAAARHILNDSVKFKNLVADMQ